MKASTLTAGGALTIGALMMTVAFISPSSASFGRGENSNSGSGNFAQMRELSDSIERSVENIDNGVIITMTSDDADAVEMLQSREAKGPQNDDVTRTQENIDNGVRITITSDDEDTVAKIQEHAAEGKGPEFGEHRGGGRRGNMGKGMCDSENFAQMRELSDSIERSVENIDNGVIITMTSDDADAVEMLQSREAKGPQNDDVTRTQENIDNGVRITITSDDEDTVAKIQEHAAEGKGPEFGEHRGGGYGEVHGHRRSEEEENEGEE